MKKKSILIAMGAFIAFGANAQVKSTPSTNEGGFILKGGVNLANISRDGGNVYEANQLTSFNAGFALDIPLGTGISIQPGLIFTGKGSKTQNGQPTDANYFRATSNPKYLELPLNMVGKIPLGGETKVMLGVGPYAAMGVGGKNKVESKVFGIQNNYERDLQFSNDDPTTATEEGAGYGKLKRFDYGFNALGGFDFGKVQLTANYGYGLVKVNSGTNNRDDDNNKHRVLSLSLGLKL
jgi:hypothetical protein